MKVASTRAADVAKQAAQQAAGETMTVDYSGPWLKRWVEKAGVSYGGLAKAMSKTMGRYVPHTYIGDWIHERRRPGVEFFEALIAALTEKLDAKEIETGHIYVSRGA